MPQSWEEHWPLPADCSSDEASRRRQRLLHTIGNLTLVSKRLNPSMSNWPWKAVDGGRGKRDELAKHSVLHLNKQFDRFEHWTEAAIENRGQELLVEAQKIWPGPNVASTSIAA
jgi:hypothetical protein